MPKISGIGPASARVVREVMDTGGSPTVERAVDASGLRADIERRRHLTGADLMSGFAANLRSGK